MTTTDELIIDGAVRLATSLHPVDMSINPGGGSNQGVRFILAEHPSGGWIAGAWRVPRRRSGSEPEQIILEPIQLTAYTPRGIEGTLTDGRTIRVTATRGSCACGGAALRTYNPFGQGVSLTLVSSPTVEKAQ